MNGEFLNVKTPDGFKFFDFELKPIKAGLRAVGKEVAKESKKAVSKKAVSKPGEFPGMQSGQLKKAIKYKVSRSGRSVWVVATRTEARGLLPWLSWSTATERLKLIQLISEGRSVKAKRLRNPERTT